MTETWLVATDFSACARAAAFEAGADLEAKYGRLLLLHVWSMPKVPGDFDQASLRQAIELKAVDQLWSLSNELREAFPNLTIETRAEEGKVAETILEIAETERAKRIAVGTHSSSAAQALLGSVAQRVMRYAKVPVLVAKAHLMLPGA